MAYFIRTRIFVTIIVVINYMFNKNDGYKINRFGNDSQNKVRIKKDVYSNLPKRAYTVRVGRIYIDTYSCGGTIIGKKWIISQAGCNDEEYHVYTQPYWHRYAIEQRIIFPNPYNDLEIAWDILLLKLHEELSFDYMFPLALPEPEDKLYPGRMVTIAGYGTQTYSAERAFLREVTIPIQKPDDCKTHAGAENWNENRQVCYRDADNGKKIPYEGDIGSGVVDCGILLAVHLGYSPSTGAGFGFAIPFARDWIRNITGI